MGTGGEDSPTGPVCSTVAAYKEYLKENAARGCVERSQGALVAIDIVIPASGDLVALVKIHPVDGSYHGYTALGVLQPRIPSGVPVTLKPGEGEKLTFSTSQHADLGAGLDLDASAAAATVKFDPAVQYGRDLRVRVIRGTYAGEIGWVYARQAYLASGAPIDILQL
jgi:hypothetical protein